MIAIAIASLAAIHYSIKSPTRLRWALVALTIALAFLAIGPDTLPWMLLLIAGAAVLAARAPDRLHTFTAVFAALVCGALLSAIWWVPVLAIRGERRPVVTQRSATPFFAAKTYLVRHEMPNANAGGLTIVNHIPEKVSAMSKGLLPALGEGALLQASDARVVATGPRSVNVDSAGWALLGSNLSYWNGWRVYWNGERMPPVIVNGAFVGTFVPPGKGAIEFRYRPSAFDAGLRISIAGALLLIVTSVWPWYVPAATRLRKMPRLAPVASAVVTIARKSRVAILPLLLILYCAVLIQRRVDCASAADGSGYLNQSRLWLSRELVVPLSLAEEVKLPVEHEFAVIPLGFVRGPKPFTMVPSYPAGLPLLMAAARLVGGEAAPFFVVPIAAALTLLAFYRLARDVAIRRSYSFCAAAVLGLCPVFLFMSIQQMSDTLATLLAIAAMICAFRGSDDSRFAFLAGVCLGVGVLVRPTQLLLLPAILIAIGARQRQLLSFLAGALPFAFLQTAINNDLYGSPVVTGYGAVFGGLRLSYFPTRFVHYCFWLGAILSPIIFPAGFLGLRNRTVSTRTRVALVAWFVAFLLFYCFYGPYETWWYTRFLLPAIPSVILLAFLFLETAETPHPLFEHPLPASGERDREAGVRGRANWRRLQFVAPAIAVVFLFEIGLTRRFAVLDFAKGEAVYKTMADVVQSRAPADAILVAMQHSGSLFYYIGKTPVRYDLITPAIFQSIQTTRPFYAVAAESEINELRANTGVEWKRLFQARDVFLLSAERTPIASHAHARRTP